MINFTKQIRLVCCCLLFILSQTNGIAQNNCTGSVGNLIFNETFGAGTSQFGSQLPSTTTSSLTYIASGCPNDGYYSIIHSCSGCYGVWGNISDHTGDPNGYFMCVNGSYAPSDFYIKQISGLCGSTSYQFSAWMLNNFDVDGAILPNVTFTIQSVSGNVIATYNTGDIPDSAVPTWKQYGFVFTTSPTDTTVVLRLTNNAPGGSGNDLSLDDITFRAAGPKITTSITGFPSDTVVFCKGTVSSVHLNASVENCFVTTAYQWQISKDTGVTWMDIAGANDTSYNYLVTNLGIYLFRLKVASTNNNLSNPNCNVLSANLYVKVNAASVSQTDTAICSAALPFSWNGNQYNIAGTYTVHILNSVGCDSIATLVLNLKGTSSSTTIINVSQNALPYLWNGNSYAAAGTYTIHLTNSVGCDSAATLVLSVLSNSCTGSAGNIIFNETFGAGTNQFGPQLPATTTTNLTYVASNTPWDGDYSIVHYENQGVWGPVSDHTGDPNGYFMCINASATPSDFYIKTITGLCEGTSYQFSAWLINMINSSGYLDPNVTFTIQSLSGKVLATYNTGDIPDSAVPTWKQYGFVFTTSPGDTSVVLKLSNNTLGGYGNDLSLDDITFRAVGPTITTSISGFTTDTIKLCKGTTSNIQLNASIESCFVTTAYQWQISKDTGNTWTDIAGAIDSFYNYSVTNVGTYLFRLKLGSSVNNLSNPNCAILSSSLMVIVNAPSSSNNDTSICANALPFTWNGLTYNAAGTQTIHYTNSVGCDSAANFILTLLPVSTATIYKTVCSSYTWHGTTYTSSGVYTFDSLSVHGCDSLTTLNLMVNISNATTITKTIASNDFENPLTVKWPWSAGVASQPFDTVGIVNPTGTNAYLTKTCTYGTAFGSGTNEDKNTITFSNITNLKKYSNLTLSFKVASLNDKGCITNTGSCKSADKNNGTGNDINEDMFIETSTDGGISWQPLFTYAGTSNLLFPFSANAPAAVAINQNAVYGGSPGGTQPTAQSAFKVFIPSGTSQFQFRFTATNNRFSENWCIDDILFTGDTTTSSAGSLPSVTIGTDTTICSGNIVTLTSTIQNTVGTVTYAWTPKAVLVDSTIANPTTVPLSSNEDFQLNIIDARLCTASSNTVHVLVNQLPTIVSQTTPTDTACVGDVLHTLSVQGQNINSYQWYSNTSPTTTGGTLLPGATLSTFTPATSMAGTTYYYCLLTGLCNPVLTTAISGAIVVNAIPIAPVLTVTESCTSTYITAIGVNGNIVWSDGGSGNPRFVTTTTTLSALQNIGACISLVSNQVTAIPPTFINVSAITGDTLVCVGNSISMMDTTKGGIWSSQISSIATISNNGLVTGIKAGTDTIKYKVISGTCIDSVYQIISVHAASTFDTSVTICKTALPYIWNGKSYGSAGTYQTYFTNYFGCDSIATLNLLVSTPTSSTNSVSVCKANLPYSWNGHIYAVAGTYTIHLINKAGCDSAATLILTIQNKTVVSPIIGFNTLCQNKSIQLSDSTAGGTWTSNNNSIATVNKGMVNGVSAGQTIITYRVTDICGTDSVWQNITVYSLPIATILTNPNPAIICVGQQVIFTDNSLGNNLVHSNWNFGGNNTDTGLSVVYTYTQASTFTVTHSVTDKNGCVSLPAIVLVTVANKPVVSIDSLVYVAPNQSIILYPKIDGLDAQTLIQWTPAIFLDNPQSMNPICTPQNDTVYNVFVTNAIGCSGTANIKVVVLDPLIIPNVFSPNGDGIHDYWDIPELIKYPLFNLKVFDRNGQIVYHCNNHFVPWNGKYRGQNVPIGVYYYILDRGYKLPVLSGSITIIR